MQELLFFKDVLEKSLHSETILKEPEQLYAPIEYILSLGGKRIRPVLTLLSCEFLGGDYKKAIPAAMAVELFHNFSLIHDDIMDEAPLRRGKETVHKKWNVNTGILSGDAMLILAYQYFEAYEPKLFQELAKLFSKTALEVCEGQQYDVDFETRNDVSIPEYIRMIEYKTAVLLGAALKMGAIIANSSEENKEGIYNFGRNLGIAFQLQDDYLDAFGNPETFGKQVGGDILANKKTFLYLTALQEAKPTDANDLKKLFQIKTENDTQKIEKVKAIFETSGAANRTQQEIEKYTQKALGCLETVSLSEAKKEKLRVFAATMMNRQA
ncbi:MAG: polyprenyl synthetase family protein [Flavobacteriaceae bacterium]|nr:polyprenyl synthetase family protein [Flavobacteriaceae bacterium]